MYSEMPGLGTDNAMSNAPRFFVDERTGCIAVRDKLHTDPEYPGLHSDTEGIVFFAGGVPQSEECPTCHTRRNIGWHLFDKDRTKAIELCERLNESTDPDAVIAALDEEGRETQ